MRSHPFGALENDQPAHAPTRTRDRSSERCSRLDNHLRVVGVRGRGDLDLLQVDGQDRDAGDAVAPGYSEHDLDRRGCYGAVNVTGFASLVLATALGWGLVTSTSPVFAWVGYLLRFVGGPAGAIGASSIGLLVGFLAGGGLDAVVGLLLLRPDVELGDAADAVGRRESPALAAPTRAGRHGDRRPAALPRSPTEPGGACLASQSLVAAGAGYNLFAGAARLGLPSPYAGLVGSGPFGAIVRGALERIDVPVLLPRVPRTRASTSG